MKYKLKIESIKNCKVNVSSFIELNPTGFLHRSRLPDPAAVHHQREVRLNVVVVVAVAVVVVAVVVVMVTNLLKKIKCAVYRAVLRNLEARN